MSLLSSIVLLHLLLLLPSYTSLAQTVVPFAGHTCPTNNFLGETVCNAAQKTCCGVAGICCAGGCCPSSANCIYQGTSKEACCPVLDPSACGARPVVSASATVPGTTCPSVVCSGIDFSWNCRYGQACNYNCQLPPCCIGVELNCGGGVSSSSAAIVVSSSSTPVVMSSSTTTVIVASSPTDITSASSIADATTAETSSTPLDTTALPSTTAGSTGTPAAASASTTTTRSAGRSNASDMVGWTLSVILILLSSTMIFL